MSDSIYNLIGALGATMIFLGFYRISIGRWTNKSLWYELDNMFGAFFLVVYQFHLKAYISVILNTIWTIVAFRGIASFASRYKFSQAKKSKKRRRK